ASVVRPATQTQAQTLTFALVAAAIVSATPAIGQPAPNEKARLTPYDLQQKVEGAYFTGLPRSSEAPQMRRGGGARHRPPDALLHSSDQANGSIARTAGRHVRNFVNGRRAIERCGSAELGREVRDRYAAVLRSIRIPLEVARRIRIGGAHRLRRPRGR